MQSILDLYVASFLFQGGEIPFSVDDLFLFNFDILTYNISGNKAACRCRFSDFPIFRNDVPRARRKVEGKSEGKRNISDRQ